MTPRECVIVIRQFRKREHTQWRMAAYTSVLIINANSGKKGRAITLDQIMPPWDVAHMSKEERIKYKRKQALKKAADFELKVCGPRGYEAWRKQRNS